MFVGGYKEVGEESFGGYTNSRRKKSFAEQSLEIS